MLRTAQSLPHQGFRRWTSTRPVSRPDRQPATGPPGSYPDRTHTGRRRRVSDQVMTAGRSPPDLWAQRLEYQTAPRRPHPRLTAHTIAGCVQALSPSSAGATPRACSRSKRSLPRAAGARARLLLPAHGSYPSPAGHVSPRALIPPGDEWAQPQTSTTSHCRRPAAIAPDGWAP